MPAQHLLAQFPYVPPPMRLSLCQDDPATQALTNLHALVHVLQFMRDNGCSDDEAASIQLSSDVHRQLIRIAAPLGAADQARLRVHVKQICATSVQVTVGEIPPSFHSFGAAGVLSSIGTSDLPYRVVGWMGGLFDEQPFDNRLTLSWDSASMCVAVSGAATAGQAYNALYPPSRALPQMAVDPVRQLIGLLCRVCALLNPAITVSFRTRPMSLAHFLDAHGLTDREVEAARQDPPLSNAELVALIAQTAQEVAGRHVRVTWSEYGILIEEDSGPTDLRVPPEERVELSDFHPTSVFRHPRIVAILVDRARNAQPRVMQGLQRSPTISYFRGSLPWARVEHWKRTPMVRRQLAEHLVRQPGVLIDMKKDPMVPWKGMKLFHGTRYEDLQVRDRRCALGWELREDLFDKDGKPLQLTAFTTPYFIKAMNYGPKVFTYRLKKEGRDLRMLDLRGDGEWLKKDKDKEWIDQRPTIDPFHLLSQLSGIEVIADRWRVHQAVLLQRLFAGVADGAILNNDVEWIWFDPPSVLEWEPPTPNQPTFLTNQLLDGSRTETGGRDVNRLFLTLDQAAERDITNEKLIHALTRLPRWVKRTSDVTHLRWRFEEHTPYSNQYLVSTEDISTSVYLPVELEPLSRDDDLVCVFECAVEALWAHFAPENEPHRYDDMWMGASVTEGEYQDCLPYQHLVELLDDRSVNGRLSDTIGSDWRMRKHLVVRLRSGKDQIIPPINVSLDTLKQSRTLKRFMAAKKAASGRRPPSATMRGWKRALQEKRPEDDPNKAQRTSGRLYLL